MADSRSARVIFDLVSEYRELERRAAKSTKPTLSQTRIPPGSPQTSVQAWYAANGIRLKDIRDGG